MFDRKTVRAYKSIRPPGEMKNTILRLYAEHKKPSIYRRLQPFAGIAACFLILFTASVLYFGSNTPLTITNYGEKVSKTPMAVALEDVPYSTSPQSISLFRIETPVLSSIALTIDTNKQTEISISGGTLLLHDDELDNTFYAGEFCTIASPSLVYWSIDGIPETDVLTLHLVTNGKTTNLSLFYDKDSETWMLAYAND